jgi:hypothetical protein
MMKKWYAAVLGVVLLCAGLGIMILGPRQSGPRGASGVSAARPAQADEFKLSLDRLPLSFEANGGQIRGPAEFLARGKDYRLFIAPGGAVLELAGPDPASPAVVRMNLEGANPSPKLTGEARQPGVSHYFIGSAPDAWKTNVPHYAKVRASGVYPGVDLAYYGSPQELEFDLTVAPGADPSRIVLALEGARKLAIDEDGDVLADLGSGTVRLRRPNIYQGAGDDRETVAGAFVMLGADRVGFEIPAYDRARPLVIDPGIVYSTYFGSGGYESISDIAVDPAGCLYAFGWTWSASFPVLNALYPTAPGPAGWFDCFVCKLNAAGDTLLFSTYFGGNGRDTASGIAVDADGDIYLAGDTDSSNFPVLGAIQPTFGGSGSIGFGDAFLTKMKSDGSALIYSTYLGGSEDDLANGVAVDADENAYVTGVTESGGFPTANAFQPTYGGGGLDAFVTKVNPAGSAFVYSTFLGGSETETSMGFGHGAIAVTSDGAAVVVGFTDSAGFPLANAYQPVNHGGAGTTPLGDAFVTKFAPSGSSLIFSTYLGGSANDLPSTVAVGADGAVYVAGKTKSSNFPTKDPYQSTYGGGDADGFVTVFSPDGSALLYSTYFGGTGYDQVNDIAVNDLGNAYIVGGTNDASFPTVDPIQATMSGSGDAYVTVFSADGLSLVFSTFLGGTGGDSANVVALDSDGNIYLGGGASAGFPMVNAIMPTPPSAGGGLLMAKLQAVSFVPGPTLTSLMPSSVSAGDAGFTLVVEGSDFVDGAVVRWDGNNRPTTFVSSSRVDAVIAAADIASGKTVQITVRNPDTGVSNALAFAINNPAPSLASISPTAVTGGGAAFTLTVTGSGFVPNSTVRWNGSARTTTYVSATELHAAVTASDLATAGEVQVTVLNSAPAGGTSAAAVFSVSGITVTSTPTSVSVTAGQSATYTIQLAPQFGSFDSAVTFACGGRPSKCTSSFSPNSVTPGAGAATTTLTLTTKASSGSETDSLFGSTAFVPPAAGGLLLALILLLALGPAGPLRRRTARRWLAAGALICFMVLISGCGGGGGGGNNPSYTGTPKGSHQITVQAVSGGMTVATVVTLVVN